MINCNDCGREVTDHEGCTCGAKAPLELLLDMKHRSGLATSLDSILGPRASVRESVHPPSTLWLIQRFKWLDDRLLQELDIDGIHQIAEAIAKAHRELEFGRPMHLPSRRRLYDSLLLDPGPEAIAAIYRMNGRPAIHTLASHRAETIHLLGCHLCPDEDSDEMKLRCGHPLPCPRHPRWNAPPLDSLYPDGTRMTMGQRLLGDGNGDR